MTIIGEVLVPLSTLREAYVRLVSEAEANVERHRLERLAEVAEIETRWSNNKVKFSQVFDWIVDQYKELGEQADKPGQKFPPEIVVRDLSVEIVMSEYLYDLLRKSLDEKKVFLELLWGTSYSRAVQSIVIRKPTDWNSKDEEGGHLARKMHAARREFNDLPLVGRGMRLNIVRARELKITYFPEDVEWRIL